MYGILQFSRRETIGENNKGIRFQSVFHDHVCVISTKVKSFVDRWAKVATDTNELIELYGSVGDYDTESKIYKLMYGLLPCRYPSYNYISKVSDYKDIEGRCYSTFTVDNADTVDMDDAITIFRNDKGYITLGIHIIDVAHILNTCFSQKDQTALLDWVFQRCSTGYFGGTSIPMFPHHLAHDIMSITPNSPKRVISLWYEYDPKTSKVLSKTWKDEIIVSNDKLTYDTFQKNKPDEFKWMGLISGTNDPHDMIAWAMKEYNKEFVCFTLSRNDSINKIALRTKQQGGFARYELYDDQTNTQVHEDIGSGIMYSHATSPIRRCIDLYNQFVYHNFKGLEISEMIDTLNDRMSEISKFHKIHSILELSHKTREKPVQVRIHKYDTLKNVVEIDYEGRIYRIPRYDSFYDGRFEINNDFVEVWGILKNGRSTLRIRDTDSPLSNINEMVDTNTTINNNTPTSTIDPEEMELVMGYPMDSFQRRCLEVINRDNDLFGTAPTGSGKTTVAMMGIMKAFNSGKRAIFSSPIKALSNEKYADMKKRLNGRVSLLTGDLKVRCAPSGGDGSPELLIMTAEILRNKLNVPNDPDLVNVGMLVVDECHYINDTDRGPVWEETLIALPKHIQIVALSATLSQPEDFCKWLSLRRHTECVIHSERHVPLHLGSFVKDAFVEITNTTKIKDGWGVDSSVYHWRDPSKLSASPTHLVELLMKNDMIPSIVFCMSRARCVQMAESFTKNLMVSQRPMKAMISSEYETEVYNAKMKDWNDEVLTHKRKFEVYVKKYLSPWRRELDSIPEYKGFLEMLYKGIAYHHSGMIPVLREFVEILFREKMIVAVFATESLGVGIDMPARTTVFTQITKPTGNDYQKRNLYTQEFMQMAGRAGRRGKDTKGYVVYYPLPAGTGGITYGEFKTMVMGKPPKAESQLKIDHDFVVRNFARQLKHLDNSLLGYNMQKEQHLNQDIQTHKDLFSIIKIGDLYHQIQGNNLSQSVVIKLNNKQLKQKQTELKRLVSSIGMDLQDILKLYYKYQNSCNLHSYIETEWTECVNNLICMQVIDDNGLTTVGRIAAVMTDSMPLVRAFMIFYDMLDNLSLEEIVGWAGLFTWTMRDTEEDEPDANDLNFSEYLKALLYSTNCYTESIYGKKINNMNGKVHLIKTWIETKNINDIITYTGLSEFGNFIKTILRTVSYMEELRTILLGIEKFHLYNKLENFEERIFYGIVSNASIYVN